jgi:hypothetical protein
MEYVWYIHFPHGKFQLTWQNFDDMLWNVLPCHQNIYWNQQMFIDFKGLMNRVFECSFMWGLQDKKIKRCISQSLVQPIFKMSRDQKNNLILRTTKMGGNCMIEKYLWNGQGTKILFTKAQYTKKHVMIIKTLFASFMNEKITIDFI